MTHLPTIAILCIAGPITATTIAYSIITAWPRIVETVIAGLALEREAGQ